mmetsp:Transcript_700/g.2657  ORF Transcript_700/g.2657 Transcript_700/m.2657 type:complete len:350 (+) Transcript_700:42-1091(+)
MSTSLLAPVRLTVRVTIGNRPERAAVRGSGSGRLRPSSRSSSTLHVVRAESSSPDAVDGGVSRAGRREAISGALAAITFASNASIASLALADEDVVAAPVSAAPKILVVGATGQTGQLVVDELRRRGGAGITAAVRSPEKASKLGIDRGGVDLLPGFDVTAPASVLAGPMKGTDVVVICTGFVPGNPFKMAQAAHAVDNEGVVHLVDAAKAAGVKRVVLISSILTDGRAMGAADSPGFKITNAFGGVLDEKLVGEKHLQASGVEYVIVRPAGLRGEPPKTRLVATPGNAMASGEVSRELVARVMAEAAFAPSAANKIVEIAEEGTFAPGYTPEGVEGYLVGDDKSRWFP